MKLQLKTLVIALSVSLVFGCDSSHSIDKKEAQSTVENADNVDTNHTRVWPKINSIVKSNSEIEESVDTLLNTMTL